MSVQSYAQGINVLDVEKINDLVKSINEFNTDINNSKKIGFSYRAIANINGEKTIVHQSEVFEQKENKEFVNGEDLKNWTQGYSEFIKTVPELKEYGDLEVEVLPYTIYKTSKDLGSSQLKDSIAAIRHFSEDLTDNKNKKTI